MQTFRCAQCQGELSNDPRLAGQSVRCPHCGATFTMPGQLAIAGQLMPPPPPQPIAPVVQQPPFIVVTAHRPQPRLHSGGWFTRSFSAASGVLTAMILFFTILPLLICGGLAYLGQSARETNTANDAQLTATASQMAMPMLKRQGIVELSNDSGAFTDRLGYVHFTGTGRNASGRLVEFTIEFKVVTFGQKTTWQMREAIVDGRMVYERD